MQNQGDNVRQNLKGFTEANHGFGQLAAYNFQTSCGQVIRNG